MGYRTVLHKMPVDTSNFSKRKIQILVQAKVIESDGEEKKEVKQAPKKQAKKAE